MHRKGETVPHPLVVLPTRCVTRSKTLWGEGHTPSPSISHPYPPAQRQGGEETLSEV